LHPLAALLLPPIPIGSVTCPNFPGPPCQAISSLGIVSQGEWALG
jgi:hypothetical protein